MSEWQPIETAPTDQSWVLLLFDWSGEPEVRSGFRGCNQDGSPVDEWYDSEAASNALNELHEPTHWMPLPDPPQG